MELGWLPGTQVLVSFAADPGFRHERVVVLPCHAGSYIVCIPGGHQYVEEVYDRMKVYRMIAGQPPRSLPDDGAKIVQFDRMPSDEEMRGLILEAIVEIDALRASDPSRAACAVRRRALPGAA